MPTIAAIALGSNLGDRAAAIRRALDAVDASGTTRVVGAARPIETEPVGPPGQGAYMNAAATVETSLDARSLLDLLLEIERSLGRDRSATAVRWGPRTIDLDLLLFGREVIDEPGLTVPHPRLHERLFVLEPLAEIAPDAVHPVLGKTVAELLADLRVKVSAP